MVPFPSSTLSFVSIPEMPPLPRLIFAEPLSAEPKIRRSELLRCAEKRIPFRLAVPEEASNVAPESQPISIDVLCAVSVPPASVSLESDVFQ